MENSDNGKKMHIFRKQEDATKANLLFLRQGYSYKPNRIILTWVTDELTRVLPQPTIDAIEAYNLNAFYHWKKVEAIKVFLYDNLSTFIKAGNKIISIEEVIQRIAWLKRSFLEHKKRPTQEYEKELLAIYESLLEDYNLWRLNTAA